MFDYTMGIRKQEFYEGAALHLLVRGDGINSVRYTPPFFTFNDEVVVLIKYSTKSRSPWGFTFAFQERQMMADAALEAPLHIALVCGADGVVAISHETFKSLIPESTTSSVRVACFRNHGEHYRVRGPIGHFERKISRSRWQTLLTTKDETHEALG